MQERTCSIDGCAGKHYGRGFCSRHYQRWRRGDRALEKLAADPVIYEHRPCSSPECDRHATANGLCGKHYRRILTSDPSRPTCAAHDCKRRSMKRGLCDTHYSRWRRNGSPEDSAQAWTLGERGNCIQCDAPVPEGVGFRRYCSAACAALWHIHGGQRRSSRSCASCGAPIDLLERYPESGRLRYSSQATCGKCRPPTNLSRWIESLIERDGRACSLCGIDVDLGLKYPDPMSSSVDHVIPRSRGGSDEFSNYAISHLICNVRKNNRLPGEVVMP